MLLKKDNGSVRGMSVSFIISTASTLHLGKFFAHDAIFLALSDEMNYFRNHENQSLVEIIKVAIR